MIRRPPRYTRTYTLFPDPTLFRSEVREYLPSSLRVVRHVRQRLSCRCCDRMAQAPAPSRPIARSFAGPGLLSHVMVSKYLDHQPLYRQCRIFERENVELSESTMGDWVGGTHHLLRPLLDARSEEHKSDLQSLMRISYAVF